MPTTPTNRQRFLICSSGRAGSTFLQLSLAQLKDVHTDYELVYWPASFTLSPHQVSLPFGYPVRKFLDGLSDDEAVVGSKLTVGYKAKYLKAGAVSGFAHQFDGLNVVFLYRNYFDALVSRTSRLVHEITDDAAGPLADRLKEHTRIVKNADPDMSSVAMGLEQAKEQIRQLYEGDLICLLLCKLNRSIVVRYEEIHQRFHEIARFIGSSATRDETDAILKTPPTSPTRRGSSNAFDQPDEVRRICEQYERRRAKLLAGNPSVSALLDYFRHRSGDPVPASRAS